MTIASIQCFLSCCVTALILDSNNSTILLYNDPFYPTYKGKDPIHDYKELADMKPIFLVCAYHRACYLLGVECPHTLGCIKASTLAYGKIARSTLAHGETANHLSTVFNGTSQAQDKTVKKPLHCATCTVS